MKRWCFVIALLLCGATLWADDPVDDPLDAAVQRLATVQWFAFGGVGFGGRRSRGEFDFKFVLSQAPAVALSAFEKLYATGGPEGRAYALCGFKKLDPARFEELLPSVAKSTDQVQVMRGCLISHQHLADLARQIDQGRLRF